MKKSNITVGSYWEALLVAMGIKRIKGVQPSAKGGVFAFCIAAALAVVYLLFRVLRMEYSHNMDVLAMTIKVMLLYFILPAVLLIFLQVRIYGKFGILGFPKVDRSQPKMRDTRSRKSKAFYEACVKAGIKEPITDAGKARMQNVAKMLKISEGMDALLAMYQEGVAYERRMKEADAALDAHLDKEKEKEEKKALDRFLGYTGPEKRKQMILAEMPEEKHSASAGTVFYQKEKDWAVAGGLASGLAGGAAGLAVAADVQAKNAQIRAHNASMKPVVDLIDKQVRAAERANNEKRAFCQKQLKRIPLLLTEEVKDAKKAMDSLMIKEEVQVSKTGTVTLNVTLQMKEERKIMNEVPAALDGFITAVLKDEKGNTDEITVTLPTYGVAKQSITVKAMSTKFTNRDARYTVSYQPKNLWLIEQ